MGVDPQVPARGKGGRRGRGAFRPHSKVGFRGGGLNAGGAWGELRNTHPPPPDAPCLPFLRHPLPMSADTDTTYPTYPDLGDLP